jgi:hypothetical protein
MKGWETTKIKTSNQAGRNEGLGEDIMHQWHLKSLKRKMHGSNYRASLNYIQMNSHEKLVDSSKILCLGHFQNISNSALVTKEKEMTLFGSNNQAWLIGNQKIAINGTWRQRTYLFVYPESLTKGISKAFAS